MPIPVTLTFAAPVRNLVVYDHLGSEHPLLRISDPPGEVEIWTSNYECCSGPRGCLDVRGEVQVGGEWEARESRFAVELGGEYAWP